MILEFKDYLKVLEKKLEILPSEHRLAFCAAIAQRMLPSYNIFAREENLGNSELLQIALDEIWNILAGKSPDIETLKQLLESCDEAYPNSNEFMISQWVPEAQRAVGAVCYTLDCFFEQTALAAARVPSNARDTLYEYLMDYGGDYINDDMDEKPVAEQLEILSNHPFTVREIKKENEDFQRLIKAEILDKELLTWLRTSFQNNGRSILDLA